jgi:hypothetical protein
MLSLFRLALVKIMLENPCTNPMRTSSKYTKEKEMITLNSSMFKESQKNAVTKNLALQILIFLAVFLVIEIAEGIGSAAFVLPLMLPTLLGDGTSSLSYAESYAAALDVMSDYRAMIPTLFCTVFGTILSIIYCRFIEKRPLSSMGIRRGKIIPHYLTGLVVGALMMSVIVLAGTITGVFSLTLIDDFNTGVILLYLAGFLVQGMSEEFIFRGYLMNTIGGTHSPVLGIIISSVGFSLAHLLNEGISVLALINLALFGAFAGIYIICFNDIWGACAIHSIWNFTQGNIYGISVSGTGETDSILRTTAISNSAFLTGGGFGIEGSIFTTVVLVVGIVLVLLKIRANSKSKR